MLSDNAREPFYYHMHPGDGTLLNATDITDADRERASALHNHYLNRQRNDPDEWVYMAAYERMMCENANEVSRLKHFYAIETNGALKSCYCDSGSCIRNGGCLQSGFRCKLETVAAPVDELPLHQDGFTQDVCQQWIDEAPQLWHERG